MAAAEVTVMGGGIFGLSIAFACACRGARVHLIERHRVGAGSSGGVVGALAPHTPENWNAKKQFQLDSLLMAEGFWADVARLSGIDPGYARLGRLQPLPDERAIAQARRRAEEAGTLWQGQAFWRVEAGTDDWRGTSPTGLWVFDSLSARLHPRRAATALVAAIRALGGTVTEQGQPRETGHPPDLATNDFPDATPTGPVIWATGHAGLLALSSDLGQALGGGVKGQAALLACAAASQPQLFVDGLHIVPHFDGTVAIGSTSEREWVDPSGTDDQLDTLIARARAACPLLASAPVTDRWAGIRPRAASRAPILGRWPGRQGHFIANGGFKIGFGMAPKVADVMADLVINGHADIPDGFGLKEPL